MTIAHRSPGRQFRVPLDLLHAQISLRFRPWLGVIRQTPTHTHVWNRPCPSTRTRLLPSNRIDFQITRFGMKNPYRAGDRPWWGSSFATVIINGFHAPLQFQYSSRSIRRWPTGSLRVDVRSLEVVFGRSRHGGNSRKAAWYPHMIVWRCTNLHFRRAREDRSYWGRGWWWFPVIDSLWCAPWMLRKFKVFFEVATLNVVQVCYGFVLHTLFHFSNTSLPFFQEKRNFVREHTKSQSIRLFSCT